MEILLMIRPSLGIPDGHHQLPLSWVGALLVLLWLYLQVFMQVLMMHVMLNSWKEFLEMLLGWV